MAIVEELEDGWEELDLEEHFYRAQKLREAYAEFLLAHPEEIKPR